MKFNKEKKKYLKTKHEACHECFSLDTLCKGRSSEHKGELKCGAYVHDQASLKECIDDAEKRILKRDLRDLIREIVVAGVAIIGFVLLVWFK